MKVTASHLRQNIYAILDEALETGVPVEIERKGRLLRIVPERKPSKLDRLKKRNRVVGDPEDFIHIDWSKEWSELK
jgi:antitoxin (DNA-binding transcriptional repressor) of toxin-antitoxin stability system